MNFLLEFFEELDELVYISDQETYEIIYMNRLLRESLGYTHEKEYLGKKCHQVLQGIESPCFFCTNAALEPGQMISWTYKNPVLNKRYLIKDSMFEHEGRKYRIEIAIDIDGEVVRKTPYYYARIESILSKCFQQVFTTTDPEQSLEKVLAYIGKAFSCDRVYVFELNGSAVSNTYEWCAEGVSHQKDILQNIPVQSVQWMFDLMEEGQIVTISDLESIRVPHPAAYAIFKPQDIHSLGQGPIWDEGKVVGFLGVDNPNEETVSLIPPLFKVLGYFVTTLLRRRDLLRKLNALSFQDSLTGAYNRNAMFEHSASLGKKGHVGVVYCDITGLKQTNDTMGHNAGDELIRYGYRLIAGVMETPWVYRSGGDEFVAVVEDVSEEEFQSQVDRLRQAAKEGHRPVAIGHAYCAEGICDLEELILRADENMYENKREYYKENGRHAVTSRHDFQREESDQGLSTICPALGTVDSLFYQFLRTTYHDMEFLFRSISQQNTASYFYFGDMQKDLFYISDNMRDEFGFESNVVPGLFQAWGDRIPQEKAREIYFKELKSLLQEKREVHDLRYQVKDRDGRHIWIRCYGILKWNEDKTRPLFFSGRITHQDTAFVVDPVTNFPRESAFFSRLDRAKAEGEKLRTIGFAFNHIAEINSTRGRSFSDHLISTITGELNHRLSDRVAFYRLEGMRCAAVIDPRCQESPWQLAGEIRQVITEGYRLMGISVRTPSSFALMDYPQGPLMPADFLEQLVSLCRVAKQDTSHMLVEYSDVSIQKMRHMSNMALALSRDVLQGMVNFRIVVQPVVSTYTGEAIGGEVLLRWNFEGKDVSPAIFVPMLEKEKIIHLVGRWVFEQAVCTCMRLVAYRPDFYLTFNVSLHQMEDDTFLDFMRDTLEKYQVSGEHLVAEMTESSMDEQPEKLYHFVEACEKMGIRMALDDFGSGYSSLRMLLQYPSAIIKLDRSRLGEMIESEKKSDFISSIVYACHRFGKKVCMEGVETEEQNGLIQEAGCDMIQGYYYHRPMEVDSLYGLLAQEQKNQEKSAPEPVEM